MQVHYSQLTDIPKEKILDFNDIDVYSANMKLAKPKIWTYTANTNSSGTAIFYPTITNTSAGKPIFTTMYSLCPSAINTGTKESNAMVATIAGVTLNTVSVKVMHPTMIIIGGIGMYAAGADVVVTLTIFGV